MNISGINYTARPAQTAFKAKFSNDDETKSILKRTAQRDPYEVNQAFQILKAREEDHTAVRIERNSREFGGLGGDYAIIKPNYSALCTYARRDGSLSGESLVDGVTKKCEENDWRILAAYDAALEEEAGVGNLRYKSNSLKIAIEDCKNEIDLEYEKIRKLNKKKESLTTLKENIETEIREKVSEYFNKKLDKMLEEL
ncbi:MAG: hypothetical protein NC191_10195 [Muribaculaceae bacterium]|nr:hypothetical protein [Muribaculaceae bacterium]